MADIVSSHDDQVEQVPDGVAVDVLDDELPDQVVGVVGITVVEGG